MDAAPDSAPEIPGDNGLDIPSFQWSAGCEGTGIGATWTRIHDDTFHRGPLIQMSDRDTVTVVWRTPTPVSDEGCVTYTVADTPDTICGTADTWGQYQITLTGLPPATEIPYSVAVGDMRTGDLTFRTMPDRPVPMKMAVFADSHDNRQNLDRMTDVALAEGVDFVVGVGDLTGHGASEQFDEAFRGWQDLGSRVNLWTVMGNHDEKDRMSYFQSFALPEGNEDEASAGLGEGWWARRIGNVWMGGGWIRDFYLSMPDTEWGQVGWFRRQFQTREFTTAQWKLFFIHEPPYGLQSGGCMYNGEQALRVALVPLMVEHGIHASIHGHVHAREWAEVAPGYHMFITGTLGGGIEDGGCPPPDWFPDPWHSDAGGHNFAIVEAGCDALVFRYMDLDGNEISRVEIPADT